MLPTYFVERLQKAHRCRPEIVQIADAMACLTPSHYNNLAVSLIEAGEDRALGILLAAAAVNKIKFDPVILANTLKVVDVIIDIKYSYNNQDESAIDPLLTVALSEDLSYERQAFAAQLAVELAIKFGYPRQPVKKVLWVLLEKIRYGEARLILNVALGLLEKEDNNHDGKFLLIGSDVLSELPAAPPPVIIGDGGTVRRPVPKLGRNEPCRCGSGKKYKKCCYEKDQATMRDASAYEGITMAQLRENPALVDDTSYIEGLRPYELKKLIPSSMNDVQLLRAYRRADIFGLRELAWEMLLELKGRPGKEKLAIEHMSDLFNSALKSRDVEMIRKLSRHIPEKDRYFSETDKLKHELLENTDKFRDLEAMCKKAFAGNEDHYLLELSYAFEDILPAMSVVFGRAAIVSEPERQFDNEMMIEAIREQRIAVDLEPWGDPIEDYWDWISGKNSERAADLDKDEKLKQLQEQLSEAREKSSLALKDLQEKEKELAVLEKKVQNVNPSKTGKNASRGVAEQNGPMREKDEEERRLDMTALKQKIELLKSEIRSQQDSKRCLRKELQNANAIISKQNNQKASAGELCKQEPDHSPTVLEKVHVPEFTDAFRKSCENLPTSLVIKAMHAAVGFASRDNAILRQTVGIERMPGHYRIRIGIHHRLIVRQTPGNRLQIEEVIPRKELDTWIRRHAP
jgi:hypothetical protein